MRKALIDEGKSGQVRKAHINQEMMSKTRRREGGQGTELSSLISDNMNI